MTQIVERPPPPPRCCKLCDGPLGDCDTDTCMRCDRDCQLDHQHLFNKDTPNAE